MSYLFIDSTYELTLGILDDDLNWLSFEQVSGHKASAIIQSKASELMERHKLKPKELAGVICVMGPGFYTGLRLSEGFVDVFRFFGVREFSFYSYEVPRFCGFKSGTWFTKAYRGEYFFYVWDGQNFSQKLVPSSDLLNHLTSDQYFIHSDQSLDEKSRELIQSPIETRKLLQEHPKEIFSEVLKGQNREVFYFRAPEDEFKVNP